MSGQEDLIRVLDLISQWLTTINSHNAVGFFDINRLAEGLATKLLNEIYGYNLENLNYEKKNYPGIDLGDKINKIGFQISTRKDPRKFFESLEKFAKGPHNTYSNGIRFLILSQEKKPRLNKDKCKNIYPGFDPDKHILTANDLLQEIRRIYDNEKEKFSRIKGILEDEIAGKAVEQGTGKIDFQHKVEEIFRLMEFEVEYNKCISGNEFEILIKKKKSLGNINEYYVCQCGNWGEKVGPDIVYRFNSVRERVKKARHCDAIIVSPNGFNIDAEEIADELGIFLYTYDRLLSELMDFGRYLDDLIEKFEKEPLEKLYIEPDFMLELTKEEINSTEFIKQWLTTPGRLQFSLLGDFGTGKTSFTRKLAYDMALSFKKNPENGKIPFFIDLRECQNAFSLHTLIIEQLKKAKVKPLNADIFLTLLSEGKILLIFDAFDEMAAVSNEKIILNNFRELNKAVVGEAKVILTSRTHYFKNQSEVERILKKEGTDGLSENASILYREISDKPEFEIVYLRKFSESQIKKYLCKAVGEKWKDFYQKIQGIYDLHDLSSRPVLIDLIVKTLPKIVEKSNKKFNLVNLYEVYIHKWMEREDRRSQFSKERKEKLMEELAYKMFQEEKKSINYLVLSDIFTHLLKSKRNTTLDLETADYEMRTASFLVRDEDGNYSFAHESFREFFIAQKIKKELENDNFSVLDSRLLSKEIVFFLLHLAKDETRILPKVDGLLKTEFRNRIYNNAFFVFYTIQKMVFLGLQFSFRKDKELSTQDEENFKEMFQTNLPININIRGISLSEWTMPYIVYKQSDLPEKSIEDSVFFRKFFEGVRFNKTNMNGSDFSGSVFKKVCFDQVAAHHCNFKNCRFENCTIKDSDFSMSNFIDAEFDACTIEGNDFVGVGFYLSDFNMKIHKDNCYLGAGAPELETTNLCPILVDQGHEDIVRIVVSSRDGRFMVSGSDDKKVKLWDLESGRLIKTMNDHDKAVLSVFISPDNRRIVSGSSDGEIKLWELESGYLIATLKKHKDRVNSVFISPDNRRIVSGSSDHTVKLWDLESGHLIKTLEGHKRAVLSVFVCLDNQRFISISSDYTVKFWNLENGHLIKTLEDYNHAVSSVFVSQDNRWIVSSGYDKRIKLWNLESGGLLENTLEGHKELVKTVFISTDNRWLISGGDDKTVKLWNLKSGDLIRTFEGHDNIVNSVFISKDNRLIVSGSCDKTIKVWDLESERLIRTLEDQKDLFDFNITNPENLQRLYYRDRLALYPARDLPELRLKDSEKNTRGRLNHNTKRWY